MEQNDGVREERPADDAEHRLQFRVAGGAGEDDLLRRAGGEREGNQQLGIARRMLGRRPGERLEQRLDADAQADIEQIKLIEELARQNEVMAESLKRSYIRLSIITIVSVAALLAAVVGLILVSGRT